ncbi:MAG: hypothetical protein CM15mP12_4560 [Gammaproteobacteria bacterium]|nr:MAG: hypothetical protein CM15mP12_4560 [Gammaproteobacteria bacterium]
MCFNQFWRISVDFLCEHQKQKIDFYPGKSDEVLIWIHGGGWLWGDRASSRWVKRFQTYFNLNQEMNVFMIDVTESEATLHLMQLMMFCVPTNLLKRKSQGEAYLKKNHIDGVKRRWTSCIVSRLNECRRFQT